MSKPMICGRPGCSDDDSRIKGYCSIYCKDVHDVELDLIEAQAEITRIRTGIEGIAKTLQSLGHATPWNFGRDLLKLITEPSESNKNQTS